jgi:hypothetical protein
MQKDQILKSLHFNGCTDIVKLEFQVGNNHGKNYKTEDIMSRNEKMSADQPEYHENVDLIDQLISGLIKIQKNTPEEIE